MNIYYILTISFIFFFSVILHEIAHGWVADRLGDPTAKLKGRLTLNPLVHIDLIGTILLPAVLMLTKSPIIFGWAKPVPVNFSFLRNPKRDMIWVGLAGPIVNIFLVVFLSAFLHLNFLPIIAPFLKIGIMVNLVLAIFNLIPIPPLDGSRFIMGILPHDLARVYAGLERYGIIIVFLLLYFGVLNSAIWPIVNFFARYLGV
ncbi:MAG: site-2 protease family protein [Candidatus Omnitrophica bacterium]|nr:site-2 protease family protein [Candidatus Omnitrophota bacterium]